MFEGVIKKMSAATLLLLGCQGLLLIAMQTVSQSLGKSGYGRFALAMSISVYASQFIQWGMDQLLTVKFARGSVEESRHLLSLLLRQKQLAALLVLTLAACTAVSSIALSEGPLIFLGALDGVCLAFSIPSMFDARGRTATWQALAFLRHSAYLVAIIFVARYYPIYLTPFGVVSLHLLCILPEVALEQLWIRRNYGSPQGGAASREAFALWRDAAPMALAVLAQQVLYNCGAPIMRAFGRESETGALYLSNQFTVGAVSFVIAPGAILHARLAMHAHEGSAFQRRVWRLTFVCAAAGMIISLAYPFVGTWIVRRFFKNQSDSTPAILFVDTWRLAPILAGVPLSSALICWGRLRAFAACHIFSALVGLSCAMALVSKYGAAAPAMGIAIGSFTCLLCIAALVLQDKREALEELKA